MRPKAGKLPEKPTSRMYFPIVPPTAQECERSQTEILPAGRVEIQETRRLAQDDCKVVGTLRVP